MTSTVTIWILNTWNLNIWIFVTFLGWFSHGLITWFGEPFENRTFFTIRQTYFVRFSDPHLITRPFDNRTGLYHSNTRLARYSDPHCNQNRFLGVSRWNTDLTASADRLPALKRVWIESRVDLSWPIFWRIDARCSASWSTKTDADVLDDKVGKDDSGSGACGKMW